MDRTVWTVSSQQQSSQSSTDPSLTGRQYNRLNTSRRRSNESNHKNVNKYHTNGAQNRQSVHWRGGRNRGSGVLANAVDCDLGSDHLNRSSDQLSDKSDNKKTFGQKKHNFNHLLNFTFDSRDDTMSDQRGHRRGQQRWTHKYKKEHFLQANCQFIVNDINDYSIHSSDPDHSVDWNSVEEIRFNSLTAETYCPICLDTPVAPKMTRCGHIYCWSCLLHYLALSDHKWRKCPICYDLVQKDDLRTVSSVNKIDYKIGDFITLCLMKRRKGSTIASPVLLYDNSHNCLHQKFEPLNGDPVISSYQKILIASPDQVLKDIICRERNQLTAQLIANKDTPEVCFVENALDQLKHREDSLQDRCRINANNGLDCDSNANIKEETKGSDAEYYYFYQCSDGQHIYLHSLNVRILKQEFGSLENCPKQLTAKIIETEWETMSEDLRKRHRYLQHLPLTAEFRIVELEFNNQFISNPTLEHFRSEVIRRQKIRSKREREERRRERHIQVEQNKRIHGIYPRPKYSLDNLLQFPTCCDTVDGLRSMSPNNSMSESSLNDDFPLTNQSTDMSANYGMSPPIEAEFPSFATMLREGKTKPVGASKSNKLNAINELPANQSDDEYQRPNYNYCLSDAFAAALELKNDSQSKKSGSKKKKNKPKVLMSTGMNRMY